MSQRPTCIRCGRPYGMRHTSTETLIWPNEPRPVFPHTNQIVVRETQSENQIYFRQQPESPNEPRLDLSDVREVLKRHKLGYQLSRVVWDGTWLHGHKPFCTLACALEVARSAVRSGFEADPNKRTQKDLP